MVGIGILVFIILITIILNIIADEEEKNNGTYNGLKSYSFWWPIGSQDITIGADGMEYAIGDPSAVTISSDYKTREASRPDHNGIDISSVDINGNRQGYDYHYIIAAKDGTVIISHLSDTAGEYIAIDHGDGFVTKYMHMHSGTRTVNVGDVVKQGQILGKMGNTGSVSPLPTAENPSAGTHLHFQIDLNGEPVDPLQYVSSENPRASSAGVDVVFNITISKADFITRVSNYKKNDSSYQNNMVAYAADFYDICKSYGINPELAFAHSCLETSYGSYFIAPNNYFGDAAYNDNLDAATVFDSPADSIEKYCKWVIHHSTVGTGAYQEDVERAEWLSEYNPMLVGTPDNNAYVLYVRYAQLDGTHIGTYGNIDDVKYQGTYYMTYYMYGEMCKHPSGSETTPQEKADYAIYSMNLRLEILHNIFGE